DNELNRVVATGILQQAGAAVTVAEDGASAVALLRGRTFDGVLMDVQMPVMDGFTATRLIRTELHLTLPVIAMTAGVMMEERQRCIDAGMDDFIGKPVEVDQMLATVARHVLRHGVPAPVQAGAAAPVTAGIFNISSLVSMSANNPAQRDRLVSLIRNMVNRCPQEMHHARTAWRDAQMELAARLVHGMRGSVGTVGAKRFVTATLALEQAIPADDGAVVEALFDQAEKELRATMAAATDWLADTDAS
ncbi:MAG: response regulator, partial [Luteimonas sp.]